MHTRFFTQFAQQYNCGAYGAGNFGEGACETQTGGSTPQPGGGVLGETGYDVLIPAALALALIIAAGILLAKKLRRRFKSDAK